MNASARASSTKSVSVVLWPGRAHHAQRPAARADAVAVGQPDVGTDGSARSRRYVQKGSSVGDDVGGDAVVSHERAREAAVVLDLVVVALRVVGHPVERGDDRAGAALDRRGEPDVVEVVVRGEDELDVLDAQPLASQPGLERRQRGVVARAGVDQRERVAAQEPGVHRADVRERERDVDDFRHEVSSSMSQNAQVAKRPRRPRTPDAIGTCKLTPGQYDLKSVQNQRGDEDER